MSFNPDALVLSMDGNTRLVRADYVSLVAHGDEQGRLEGLSEELKALGCAGVNGCALPEVTSSMHVIS